MILQDSAIMDAWLDSEIKIVPFELKQLQPASYDLRLGFRFAVLNPQHEVDVKQDNSEDVVYVGPTESIYIFPGQLVLATTEEWLAIGDKLVGRVEGKSSLGRLGLQVHSTAGFIDPGFQGEITLELSNCLNVPIKIYAGMPVAQICFERTVGKTKEPYTGKYQGQTGPQPSRYHLNFQEHSVEAE